ncbi:MAG: polysaccharide deacetylase family protein [Parashewanella sp.]
MLKKVILNISLIALLLIAKVANSAVILQYHHVSDDTPSATSVSLKQFKQHMDYLAANHFNVISLSKLIRALQQGQALPAKTIAITFDDGYSNILHNAHSILKEHKFPYAMFIAIHPIEKGYNNMMNWQQITRIAKEGAEIMNHSYGHDHLIRKQKDESQQQWLRRVKQNLLKTEAVIKRHTGKSHKVLAYPYGEYNQALMQLLADMKFTALGQQSGAVGKHSNMQALSRFPVAGKYADLSRLKIKLTSLPLPVIKQTPMDPQLAASQQKPLLRIKLSMKDIHQHLLKCYVSGQGEGELTWKTKDIFEVKSRQPLPAGRSRYNCTAPSKTQSGYYWFSHAWVKPNKDGSWVQE